jgi:hypothetical protein
MGKMRAGIEGYPELIARCQHKINVNLEKSEGVKFSINEIVFSIERLIAFDESLKNEQQRKSRKSELLAENSDYGVMMSVLMRYELIRREMQIDLEKLQNEFVVLKLLKRESIAKIEAEAPE